MGTDAGVSCCGGYYAPPGTNPQVDLTTWYGAISAGEPYDANPEIQFIEQQMRATTH